MTYLSLLLSFVGTKAGRYAALGALGAMMLLAAYVKGRSDYKEVCEAKALAEHQRQVKANETARQAAETVIEGLERANDKLSDQLREVQDAADKDPAATVDGIGADSVRRIDEVR